MVYMVYVLYLEHFLGDGFNQRFIARRRKFLAAFARLLEHQKIVETIAFLFSF